jgi:hypothetical protein
MEWVNKNTSMIQKQRNILRAFILAKYCCNFWQHYFKTRLPDDSAAIGNTFSQAHPKGITDHWMNELYQNSRYYEICKIIWKSFIKNRFLEYFFI